MSSIPSQWTVVGLGELLWDLLPAGKQLGGAPANFAYHAKVLCGCGLTASCIGQDDLGQEIVDCLEERALDLSYIAKDPERPTGTVSVDLDDQGKPQYTIHEGVAWDFIPSSDGLLELAVETDAVCFGSLAQRSAVSRETIRQFLKATPRDALRVFDINLRQAYYNEEVVRTSLELSNVLKLNDEELPVVGSLLSIEGAEAAMLDQLMDRFTLRAIALTKGDMGSVIVTPEARVEHPGFTPEQIADTVGAGDSFSAAVVVGLLRADALETICEHANRLASFVCTQPGAMPLVPDDLKV